MAILIYPISLIYVLIRKKALINSAWFASDAKNKLVIILGYGVMFVLVARVYIEYRVYNNSYGIPIMLYRCLITLILSMINQQVWRLYIKKKSINEEILNNENI
ncbi:MAG: hypothetical protein ACK5G7_04405 [Erysipelotrichaceae bacterium]